MDWIDVANAQDIGKGKLKLVEAQGKKMVIANVDDRFYAFNERCPHMNAPLHLGTLQGKVITCPLHFATYDVTTGKKLSEPKMTRRERSCRNYRLISFRFWERWGNS